MAPPRTVTNVRQFYVPAPFIDGYVSDLPPELLGQRMAARLENMMLQRGYAERRRGWVFDGGATEGDAVTTARGFDSVARVAFKRVNATRTLMTLMPAVSPYKSSMIVHGSGVVTSFGVTTQEGSAGFSAAPYLLRTTYRDELIGCCQSGQHPLIRYAGAPSALLVSDLGSMPAGIPRVENLAALPAAVSLGMFVDFRAASSGGAGFSIDDWPFLSLTPSEATAASTTVSVTGVSPTTAIGDGAIEVWFSDIGFSAPCVSVYTDGVYVRDTNTGVGTRWQKDANVYVDSSYDHSSDALVLYTSSGGGTLTGISSNVAPTDTTLDIIMNVFPATGKFQHSIMRRMPFKEAAVFRQCFFGCGVERYRSRLYYYPPGADLGIPPGYSDGGVLLNPSNGLSLTDASGFEMSYVEVPSSFDSDPIVALLPTDTALYAVKRSAVYRITGDYPNFRSDFAMDGTGCLDIRSAITDETGVYWAGDTGIWTIRGGLPYNLAGGDGRPGILQEWRDLMAEGIEGPTRASTSWVACGVAEGHLIVSVQTALGTKRCFVLHIQSGRWCGRFTNCFPKHIWSSRIQGETSKAYAVTDDQKRRVLEVGAMFRGSTWTDGDGTAPLGVARTGSRMFVPESELREFRLSSLDVGVVLQDGSTPTTTVNVSVLRGDAVDQAADATSAQAAIVATTSGDVKIAKRRPGTRGRRQALELGQVVQDSSFAGFEVHEVSGDVRMLGDRR